MVFFNYTTMQMTAKIVYYGPGLCGKTTNLQAIHQRTAPQSRGEMVSLETETDRTLFFDLLPLEVGVIGGMKVRLQLYTVPGQVFYNATRKLVLKGVDGVVFVADSQEAAFDANMESLNNLRANLSELNIPIEQVPLVFQYNKRDLRNILPLEQLGEALNPGGAVAFEAAALHGVGVFETLKAISRLAITAIRQKAADEPRAREALAGSGNAAGPARGGERARRDGGANPLAALVTDASTAEEMPVEFASEDTDKHLVPVRTKGHLDIQQELEKLRVITAAAANRPPAAGGSAELERRLKDILIPGRDARQEVRRKATLEVPAHLLKGSTSMRIHLGFDGDGAEEFVRDAVQVKLVGNRRLERLTLHIELDIKGRG